MKYRSYTISSVTKYTLRQWREHESIRFMFVGAYNTLFGLIAFALLHQALHHRLHYLVILPIAHILAVINAFIGHRAWTYRVQNHLLADFLRFNISYLGLLALGMVAMPILVKGIGVHPILASALTLGITTFISFFVHKKISFRRNQKS